MHIDKVIRSMGIGSCKPYLISCSDGKKYVAKFPGNPEGKKTLVNEYVCAELAKLFELPVPIYKLVSIENIDDFGELLHGINKINGTIFCSEFIEKANPVPDFYILTKVTNHFDTIKTLIFDVIIGNNDRNEGNILINLKNNSFVIIDHSHVFINEAIWNVNSLRRHIELPIDISQMNRVSFDFFSQSLNIKGNREKINDYLLKIKNINSDVIYKIINSIPADWNVTEEEKNALIDFILNRISRINEICSLLNI